jgi:hypothetical protein
MVFSKNSSGVQFMRLGSAACLIRNSASRQDAKNAKAGSSLRPYKETPHFVVVVFALQIDGPFHRRRWHLWKLFNREGAKDAMGRLERETGRSGEWVRGTHSPILVAGLR